jgi:hypothetical protein
LQQLARQAQAGDKHAQLELGIRYEEGRGVPVDPKRAGRLYRLAASDRGGDIHVFSPPVGSNSSATILSIQRPQQLGLLEAKVRLERLK